MSHFTVSFLVTASSSGRVSNRSVVRSGSIVKSRSIGKTRLSRVGAGGLLLVLVGVLASARVAAADEEPKRPGASEVTYHGQVEAIVKERCLGCHGGEKPKGRFSMETLADVLEGGRKGESLVAGNLSESRLFQLITATEKPVMPPKKQGPLTKEEVAVFRAWILGGLKAGEKRTEVAPYSAPLSAPLYTRAPAVTAMAYDQSGRNLYVAGYKEILVYEAEPEGSPSESSPLARLLGEAESVNTLQVSPDGLLLAAVGGSPARFGELQLWETGSHQLARYVRLGSDCLYAVAFSASGDRLAVAGTDRAVHVLDVKTGETIYSSEIHSDWIFGVAFSGDGTQLVSAGRDRTVKVSAAGDGKFLKNLATIEGPVMRVVHRPGTQQFLIGAQSRHAIFYDAKEMKEVRKLERQPGAVLAVAISGDGKLAAVGGDAAEVRVYESEAGKRKWKLTGHKDWIYALAFRPDGQRLATSGYEGVVRIYDMSQGKETRSFSAVPISVSEGSERVKRMRTAFAFALVLFSIGGCQHRSVMVHDTERGMQWHWPHFLDGKPTILAFWSTEETECLYAMDGLNTLSLRDTPVEVISVAAGPDIEEIHAWIDGRRGTPIRVPVLMDQKRRLASAVNVTHYPTYIYFDTDGDEIDRSYRIDNISKWLNNRWLRKSGAAP